MSFYDGMASTASRLIKKYGSTLMLVRSGDSTDPITGAITNNSAINMQINTMLKNYPDNLIDGTRIKSGDRLVILDNKTEPLLTDKITLQNQDWNIEGITTSKPANTALVYFVQVRK